MLHFFAKERNVLLVAFILAIFVASIAEAEENIPSAPVIVHGDVLARPFPTNETYKQVVLRGEVAQYLYEALDAVEDRVVTRASGSTYLVREATGIACSRSDLFQTPHFACVSFLAADGSSPAGYLDPEFGGTAGIRVGN